MAPNLVSDAIDSKVRISLEERLRRRTAIEAARPRSKTFLERSFQQILKTGLQMTGLYSRGLKNALQPVVRPVRFWFDNLPAEFDGFLILHLSDLHIDGMDGLTGTLTGLLSRIRPDLCVMTGDYRFEMDGPCDVVYTRMRSILASISVEQGIFAILGNHDASEIAHGLEDLGVNMLINEAAEIRRGKSSLWLAGVDDPHGYGYDDLDGTLAQAPPYDFKILLAHTPELFRQAADSDIDLYLCGHTHAGQIRLPWAGPILQNADCPKAHAHGKWRHEGLQGYTSAGVGCSTVPVRYNCPPEIVLIELRSAR